MHEISLQQSQTCLNAALTYARQHGLAPVTAVVLDSGGHTKAAVREDGSGYGGLDIATAKARGALMFGLSSRAIGELFGANPAICAALSTTLKGQLLPIAGALLICRGDGSVAGAISVAGDMPDNDEAAAAAGLNAAALP